MADTLKSVYTKSNGTAERKILDGAGSNIVYTIFNTIVSSFPPSAFISCSILFNSSNNL